MISRARDSRVRLRFKSIGRLSSAGAGYFGLGAGGRETQAGSGFVLLSFAAPTDRAAVPLPSWEADAAAACASASALFNSFFEGGGCSWR